MPMVKQRIMTVFGTRPEGIKMMPVVREIRTRESLDQIVCVTGQHRQMLDQVFAAHPELEILAGASRSNTDDDRQLLTKHGAGPL